MLVKSADSIPLHFRHFLAALHYNYNSDRMQAVTINAKPHFTVRAPKFKKGEYTLRKERTHARYG